MRAPYSGFADLRRRAGQSASAASPAEKRSAGCVPPRSPGSCPAIQLPAMPVANMRAKKKLKAWGRRCSPTAAAITGAMATGRSRRQWPGESACSCCTRERYSRGEAWRRNVASRESSGNSVRWRASRVCPGAKRYRSSHVRVLSQETVVLSEGILPPGEDRAGRRKRGILRSPRGRQRGAEVPRAGAHPRRGEAVELAVGVDPAAEPSPGSVPGPDSVALNRRRSPRAARPDRRAATTPHRYPPRSTITSIHCPEGLQPHKLLPWLPPGQPTHA